ncbi:ribosomal-processing cysteine protease Prp [Salsuginibacillus kocurii]|uniref:ribosomal-processing cysteine protease Prp n=1 Tax=Salsuginibacillus kocurii TaxID=427078 RepID=UPI0003644821|nr:ribosomal-processing cysteine protease Prp [Salsuginibacillus kocurii]
MIHVNISRHKNGAIQAFSMTGHADAGPHGHDIVCAGASAVAFGAINSVYVLCGESLQLDMGEDGGYLHCVVPESNAAKKHEEVQLLVEGMIVSLQSIAESYNEFIEIHDQKGGEAQ